MFNTSHKGLSGLLVLAAAILFAICPVFAEDPVKGAESRPAKPKAAAHTGDAYPLSTCPVSDEPLGGMGKPVVFVHEGREVRLCCSGCQKDFDADPAKFLQKIDSQIIEQQSKSYPLETCPVSGEKLGGMGEPVKIVVGNRLVELCCGGCVKKAQADPAATIKKLDDAVIAKEKAGYPLKTCVVSGEELAEGQIVEMVHANHLVRFCCGGCVKSFKADPAKFMAQVEEARAKAAPEAPAEPAEPEAPAEPKKKS